MCSPPTAASLAHLCSFNTSVIFQKKYGKAAYNRHTPDIYTSLTSVYIRHQYICVCVCPKHEPFAPTSHSSQLASVCIFHQYAFSIEDVAFRKCALKVFYFSSKMLFHLSHHHHHLLVFLIKCLQSSEETQRKSQRWQTVVIASEQQVSLYRRPVAPCHTWKHVTIWSEIGCQASCLQMDTEKSVYTLPDGV